MRWNRKFKSSDDVMNIQFPFGALPNTGISSLSQNSSPAEPSENFQEVLANTSSEHDQIAGAAKQFEALIAGQVLKAVHESEQSGWLADDDDQTGQLTLEMAEQSFAQALANQGGFGIAKIVTKALDRRDGAKTANSASTSSPRQALPLSTQKKI